ncbi:MAG TPA: hypothetical protein PK864_05590 [Syntrophorhabdaceae bacterium]|nr:hypothetical protein [Syntrophorhabdaceae bacterium]HOL04835.1 hypothetical protein [Syntrophorhabdaceae bacterium]HON85483.1 hypothetical protein [Syntrophorhabdaceae bacterium]HOT42495.1 hypothetical protein [Syntrophorhabdaceae bacterium]HPC65937.1 hypothetical protein [Syntrophorhabdaceae bacterium]
MVRIKIFLAFLLLVSFISITGYEVYAKDEKVQRPKEYGVYIKTKSSLVRLIPNIVFDEGGLIFVESNNPQTFALKDIQYFIIYGQYDMDVLTFNPMLFYQASALGKPRFVFGKDIEIIVKKQKTENLYTVRPKGLFSRGYFSLWINDTAWDFVIE